MSSDTGEATPTAFDAENATAMTIDFLKRLGYKQIWQPMKVSLDGELYIVEMMFHTLNAKVQINSKTKEIKEYEFQGGEPAGGKTFFQSKLMMLIVAGIPTAILALKLIGVF
jgi:hypothetical protein